MHNIQATEPQTQQHLNQNTSTTTVHRHPTPPPIPNITFNSQPLADIPTRQNHIHIQMELRVTKPKPTHVNDNESALLKFFDEFKSNQDPLISLLTTVL